MGKVIDSLLAKDPVFQRVLADGLSIQDRFSAEPTYGRTGKGTLKSSGVEEMARAKRRTKRGRGLGNSGSFEEVTINFDKIRRYV